MNIIHLNTYDIEGGAARAAYRIHKGLCDKGIDSSFFSRYKYSNDKTVHGNNSKLISKAGNFIREKIERFPLKLNTQISDTMWSTAWYGNKNLIDKLNLSDADIINLHWINLGFLSIKDISKIKKPIVWTLHDMWAFTGGCHYSGACTKYTDACNSCFQLNSAKSPDISTFLQSQKKKYFKNIQKVITPSLWMGKCAQESSIFKEADITVIPYGLDTQTFKPNHNNKDARKIFNLPEDKILILFPGYPDLNSKRKGFTFVIEAIKEICNGSFSLADVELVVLGKLNDSDKISFPIKINYINRLKDDVSLAMLYSLSDFSLCPSMEDNLPNTVLESLSCGTPVIGFDIGGIPDMIKHNYNGFIVRPFDIYSMGSFIKTLIQSPNILEKFSFNARLTILNDFNVNISTQKYIDLYQELKNDN